VGSTDMVIGPALGVAVPIGLAPLRAVGGLVTLPGAFVGMLLGGASPVAAGAVQLLVLVMLLAVGTVAAAVTVELVCRRYVRRSTEPAVLTEKA
jgi:putative ABC transport system permease protein